MLPLYKIAGIWFQALILTSLFSEKNHLELNPMAGSDWNYD